MPLRELLSSDSERLQAQKTQPSKKRGKCATHNFHKRRRKRNREGYKVTKNVCKH